jgi:hypothetical protein
MRIDEGRIVPKRRELLGRKKTLPVEAIVEAIRNRGLRVRSYGLPSFLE